VWHGHGLLYVVRHHRGGGKTAGASGTCEGGNSEENMKNAIRKKVGGRRPGAGRPATGSDPSRTFRLSDEFMATLDAWSARQDDAPSAPKPSAGLSSSG
jgi:hypothetical protein